MADSDRLTRVLNDYAPKYAIPIFAAVGFLTILRPVLSYIRLIFSLFILRGTSLQKYGRKGSWALITGASDGIGKEYAVQLAAAGFNVVLVSRTDSKLQMLAHDIENRYAAQGIKAKTLAMDFARNDDADYAKLKALVDGLDIAVLVNNVGKSHDIPVPFVLTPKEEVLDIVTINCIGTLRVTQIVAAGMIQRKRGLILTMGSFGGFIPTPLLATYSGSKAFLQQWSTALGSELKPHGVQVELVLSYLVTSAMSKIRRPTIMIPTPKKFVKSVLSKVGRSGGAQGMASTSTPFWSHGIAHWWIVTCLGVYNSFVTDRNRVMHESIRSRALKKKERDPKKLS